jgi:protein-L-isoaspartate(D-aspartate) O-methyltransferase
MTAEQIAARGISDEAVLHAFRTVPRDEFVPGEERWSAHQDRPLPIGHGATISQPYIVALMTESLGLSPSSRVLEIGAGSGYGAAILAEICEHVVTVEIVPELVELAQSNLEGYGARVEVILGDGSAGHPDGAPYDAISVTAAARTVPEPLLEQLASNGRLVIPVHSRGGQELVRITRSPHGDTREVITQVRFVPLVGGHGT